MKIDFFCPRWGSEALRWEDFCRKAKDAGYDGIELGFAFDEKERVEQREALEKYQLKVIGQYWQSLEPDFTEHKSAYKDHLCHLASLKPLKIDSQTGKDYFSFEQNKELFDIASAFTKETGIVVAHETHRNKALFAAHVTKQLLERIPSLTITADFSHWCNVAESFLEDQQDALAIAIKHTVHIHARVGHTEGPQVTDPRLPEWQTALEHHCNWWEKIFSHHMQSGTEYFTITPEFGPAPYMMHHPETKDPLANQWEINEWMMNYLKEFLKA